MDGTKIEADANKYSFVWKKSTSKYEKMLKIKIEETLRHIEEITQLESSTETTDIVDEPENLPSKLVEVTEGLEEKVASLTEEIK